MIVRNGRKGLRSLLSLILAVNILLSLFPGHKGISVQPPQGTAFSPG